MYNTKIALILLRFQIALLIMFCVVPVNAQTHNWNIKPREKSQIANSRALNLLKQGSKVKGSLDQAISILVEATNTDPTDPIPLATLGLALDLKGRHEEALKVLDKSYHLDRKATETMLSIGVTYYVAHNFDYAVDMLSTLLRTNPSFCPGHANLGFAYMRQGDFQKAKQQFQKAIDCSPNSQQGYQGLALVDYLTGNLDQAFEEAEHAESLTNYPPVTLLLAEICFLRGDQGKLRACLQKLSRIKLPIQERPMTVIGYSKQHDFQWDPYLLDNFDQGNFLAIRNLDLPVQAKKQKSLAARTNVNHVIEKAFDNDTEDYFILHQLGLLNLAKGNYDEAVQQFNRILTINPNAHVDFLYLGRALSLAGKAPEAAQCVSEYQRHFPEQGLSQIFSSIRQAAPAQTPAQQVPPDKPPDRPPESGF